MDLCYSNAVWRQFLRRLTSAATRAVFPNLAGDTTMAVEGRPSGRKTGRRSDTSLPMMTFLHMSNLAGRGSPGNPCSCLKQLAVSLPDD